MADAYSAVSHGALRRITSGEHVEEPILQCVQIKEMNSQPGGPQRFRVVWNDTVNFIQSMLAVQTSWIVTDGKLKKGNICRLKQFQANIVKDKPILVAFDLDILEEYGEPDKLGTPQALDGGKPDHQDPQPGNITGSNFYGNRSEHQPQQPPTSRTTQPSHSAHANIYPIEALSPYAHKWTIKARCTHKGEIKTWHNQKGEGKLFSCNFLDDSGEIRATGFNDAVDSWYEMIQEGGVYYITTPCRVQLAKRQFSNVNNDYELTFERDTQIEKAEDTEGVPQVTYNFTSIADLQTVQKDTTIDCIGILQSTGEVSEITSKTTNKPYSKRELTLVDNTGYNVRLTIWGNTAMSFDAQEESVVAFKGVKVSDFGGRSLSLLSSGSININPDVDEAYKLKGWYDGAGRNETFQSHQNTMGTANATTGGRNDHKTIAQVKDENLGMSSETDWFSVKATIIYVKQDNVAYPACMEENCNKKVVEIEPGQWRCEKCDKTFDRPNYRYIMSINVSDHTGQIWLSCFDDVGREVMGMDANEFMKMRDEGDTTGQSEVFQTANCKTFVFRCKAKMDTFQDQQRVRYQVQYANPLNFVQEAKKLADIIKQYSLEDNSLFVT
ncbi:replication factor-a protein [Polychaeton citri CBS 116435]|uniref:Replication protein A subunit n=1 Tax=Polychaeton citri CBS 116435 TaxID=1314669 RepID=A0A9P4QAB7_9PEZI|nr:replication factor-a protein [Polychaeton citri CBS 116435]